MTDTIPLRLTALRRYHDKLVTFNVSAAGGTGVAKDRPMFELGADGPGESLLSYMERTFLPLPQSSWRTALCVFWLLASSARCAR